LRQFRQLNDTASVNARLPYWQTEADGGFSHSDVGPFGNHCSRLSVSNEKAYFVRLVGRIEWCSDQPGVSQCEKYDNSRLLGSTIATLSPGFSPALHSCPDNLSIWSARAL
jgi:hypothetical protein